MVRCGAGGRDLGERTRGTAGRPAITGCARIPLLADPTAPEQALIPSSPRSVEACFRLGVDPVDLQYHPPAWYARKEDADNEVSQLRYDRNEAVRQVSPSGHSLMRWAARHTLAPRTTSDTVPPGFARPQERLRALMDARKHLIDEGWQPPGGAGAGATGGAGGLRREDSSKNASSAMVEKEKQRLEVLKRRQERELQQMVQHEATRKELLEKQQRKVEELEARTRELVRLRQEHELQRMQKQREIELQKAREEKDNERKARQLAEERYQ